MSSFTNRPGTSVLMGIFLACVLTTLVFSNSTALADTKPRIGNEVPTLVETIYNFEEYVRPKYRVYADTYYNIEEEELRTEFASEVLVRDFTVGLYPLVNFDEKEMEELKFEVKYDIELNSFIVKPYGEMAWDEDLEHSESTLGFKVSKTF